MATRPNIRLAGKPSSLTNLWVPDRKEVIWIDFSPQAGKEMSDEHPMLVLSTKAFNQKTGIVIGLAMTHSDMNEDNPFAVEFKGPKGEVCYVLCHQPKSFDWRQRPARQHSMKQVTPEVFKASCDLLNQIIALG